MGLVYDSQGSYDKAMELYRQALAIYKTSLGKDHPTVATTWNNMGTVHYKQGKYRQALELYRQALPVRQKSLGPNHPYTLATQKDIENTMAALDAAADG